MYKKLNPFIEDMCEFDSSVEIATIQMEEFLKLARSSYRIIGHDLCVPPMQTFFRFEGVLSLFKSSEDTSVGVWPKVENSGYFLAESTGMHPARIAGLDRPIMQPIDFFESPMRRVLVTPCEVERLDLEGIFVSQENYRNFGHFTLQVLPSILQIADQGDRVYTGCLDPIHRDVLSFFNALDLVTELDITYVKRVASSGLRIASALGFNTGFFLLRQRFLSGQISQPRITSQALGRSSAKIVTFLTKGPCTRISNKHEVAHCIAGVQIVEIDSYSMSLDDVACMLSRSSVIICEAGANYCQLVFANLGAKLVYLCPIGLRSDVGMWNTMHCTIAWMFAAFETRFIPALGDQTDFSLKSTYDISEISSVVRSFL